MADTNNQVMTDPAAEHDSWLRNFHPSDHAETTLVCFPHAGGSASFYHSLSAELSPETEVFAVQYPGRQDRRKEPLIDDVGELADSIAELFRVPHERPLAFFGHSMGAIIAFEVARRLEHDQAATAPVALFASGRRAPGRRRDEHVHELPVQELIAHVVALGGPAGQLLHDEELGPLLLPSIRNDYRAIERYRCAPGATVSAPVTVLVGDQDPMVTADEAGAWRAHTTADTDISVFPGGDHFYLAHRTRAVADLVRARLAAVPTP